MKNGIYAKILAGLLVVLLTSAIIGGWNLSNNVSAMGADIKNLTTGMSEVKSRLWSVEQALRNGK